MFCSIFLSAGLPSDTYNIWWPYSYPLNQSFCILQGLLSETSTNATVLTITSFTIERYIAICHPFRLVPICYAINIHYLGYILSVFGVLGANGECRTPLTMALLLLLNLLMHARIQSIYVKFSCVTELNACSSILHRRIARLKKCRIIARHADITNNIAGDDRVASRKHCEGIADNHHKFYDYRAIRRSSWASFQCLMCMRHNQYVYMICVWGWYCDGIQQIFMYSYEHICFQFSKHSKVWHIGEGEEKNKTRELWERMARRRIMKNNDFFRFGIHIIVGRIEFQMLLCEYMLLGCHTNNNIIAYAYDMHIRTIQWVSMAENLNL